MTSARIPLPSNSRQHRQRLAKLWAALGTLALTLGLSWGAFSAPFAHADELDQVVGDNEKLSTERATIPQGHMDIGPRIIDNKWQLAIRDDSADTPTWRLPQDVVFTLGDKSILTVPESGDYDFTGAKAGSSAYVIPQSQIPGVPWLGWNTQSPDITKAVSRGINLTFLGAQGPGNVNVFLESGNFSKPTQLWDKRKTEPQPIWVDLHTHTHATWVFTEPGVYLLAMNASATGTDGKKYSNTSIFRFAVGPNVTAEQAFDTEWQGEIPSAEGVQSALAGPGSAGTPDSAETAPTADAAPTGETATSVELPAAGAASTPEVQIDSGAASSGYSTAIVAALVAVAVIVAGGGLFVVRRSRAAKQAAARSTSGEQS